MMRWWTVIAMCCVVGWTGCASHKPYERHVEPSYTAQGQPRPGYATLNVEYLEALLADLDACYAKAEK